VHVELLPIVSTWEYGFTDAHSRTGILAAPFAGCERVCVQAFRCIWWAASHMPVFEVRGDIVCED
jgi:hypothetical protein